MSKIERRTVKVSPNLQPKLSIDSAKGTADNSTVHSKRPSPSILRLRYPRIIRDGIRIARSRHQTPPRPPIRLHTQANKAINLTRQRLCSKVCTIRVRVDIETAIGIAAPIDAHGIESRIKNIATGGRKADGRFYFFTRTAGVGEDANGLEEVELLERERNWDALG